MDKQSFDYVVADSFASTVNVKVGMNNEKRRQADSAFELSPFCYARSIRRFMKVYPPQESEVSKCIRRTQIKYGKSYILKFEQ